MTGVIMHYKATTIPVTASTNTVITTGLVLHLDAGNPASYSGTGTVWNNLVQTNTLKGTLSTATYSSNDGGSMVFNGSFGRNINVTTASIATSSTNNISVEVWYKSNNTTPRLLYTGASTNGINFGQFSINPTTWKVTKYGVIDLYIGTIPSTSTWHQAVVTYSSSTGVKVYVDGVVSGTTSTNKSNIVPSTTPTITIGISEGGYHNGSISIVRWYNTVLSDANVLQNFNANRSRYGI